MQVAYRGTQVWQAARADRVDRIRAGILLEALERHRPPRPVGNLSAGYVGQERPAYLRRPGQAWLDGVGVPRRITFEEVSVQIDHVAVLRPHLGEDSVDAPVVGPGLPGV